MDKLEILKRSDLFRELKDEQIKSIAEMCVPEVFEPGAIIHRQNTILNEIRVIEEGLVALVLELGPLSHRQLTAATNFETIGWSAVVPPHVATTTAKAVERTKVLTFKGQDIVKLCETNCRVGCPIYQGVSRVVADRLHAAFMQCVGVTAQD
ncbi:MAG: cyclic nucleotide-binding domain-containing protein [Dehalococcoidia bacterium]|jgi:CRP/FNR family cyclic AMP-dependent transcriptional regulator